MTATREQIALRLQRLAARLATLSIAVGSGCHAAPRYIATACSNIEDELDDIAEDEREPSYV